MYSANKLMYLDDDDRRAIVIKIDKRIDLELAKAVSHWLGLQPVGYASEEERAAEMARINDARSALIHYFQNEVEIDSEYDPEGRAPHTAAREEVVDYGRSEIDDFVHEAVISRREDAGDQPEPHDLIVVETVSGSLVNPPRDGGRKAWLIVTPHAVTESGLAQNLPATTAA
jgi:hypothetical protein